jgi:hypothetical protein
MERDEIDLSFVITALRRRWAIILGCAVAGLILGAIQLRSAPPVYEVAMTVAAVEHAAYDSRLAEAAPGTVPHQAAARQAMSTAMTFTLYLESLHSRNVADALAGNPEALKSAGQSSGAGLYRAVLQGLVVEQDPKKHAFATVRMRSGQPQLAARFLALLHQAADDQMRRKGLEQAQQSIATLQAVPNAQSDAVVAKALGEARVTEAAALSKAPFAAQILDDPAASPDPISNPLRSLVSALVLGLAAGMAIALALQWIAGRSARR